MGNGPISGCRGGVWVLPGPRSLPQGVRGRAGAHLSLGGFAGRFLAPALALLEGRAGDAADDGVHAAGTGVLAGGRGGQLRGAAGQVGLRALALHLVHPETALLAQVLQAAEGEEREQRYFGGREAPLQVSPAQSRALPGAGVLQLHVPQLPARSMDAGQGGLSTPTPCPSPPQHPTAAAGAGGCSHGTLGPSPQWQFLHRSCAPVGRHDAWHRQGLITGCIYSPSTRLGSPVPAPTLCRTRLGSILAAAQPSSVPVEAPGKGAQAWRGAPHNQP